MNNTDDKIEHIESCLTLNTAGNYSFNFATWESAIHGFSTVNNLRLIRKQLFADKTFKPTKPLFKK